MSELEEARKKAAGDLEGQIVEQGETKAPSEMTGLKLTNLAGRHTGKKETDQQKKGIIVENIVKKGFPLLSIKPCTCIFQLLVT